MSQLLAIDRVPYRVLSVWATLVRATLVWLLLSLPILTAPAATVVLLHSADRVMAGEQPPTLGESCRMTRAYFVPALRLAALVGLGTAVTASAVLGPSPGGVWDTLLPLIILPVAATWVLTCQWCFALLDANGAVTALRNSYLRAIRRPDLATLSALGTAALPVAGLLMPASVSLPFWLTAPSIGALLVMATCRRAAPAGRRGETYSSAQRGTR